MRRVSAKYAKPAMMLGRPVYDSFGRRILKEGTRLNPQQVETLPDIGATELFILDRRVDDVSAWPLITPELEGITANELRKLLYQIRAIVNNGKAELLDITRIKQLIYEMVQQLFPIAMGEPVVGGSYSLKDYIYVHPVKVASLSLLMGKTARMSQRELINLGLAALLQNIGYVILPQSVLENGLINDNERQTIQMHPVYGAELINRCLKIDAEVPVIIRQHHERWNGSGYPEGLKSTDVTLGARIIGILDTACALVSKRPYRGYLLPNEAIDFLSAFVGDLSNIDSLQPHQAMEFIVAYSGELYDPELVKFFSRQFPPYPSGLMVKLNTGEIGIVSSANTGFFARPKVRICYDKDTRAISKPYDINLADAEHQHKLVTEVLDY